MSNDVETPGSHSREDDRHSALTLVVEDDAVLRRDLCEAINDTGFPAVGATNGADAAAYLSSGAPVPSMILLDLNMEVVGGPEFQAWMRLDPRLRHVPIVIMSSRADLEAIGRDLGAAGILAKPFPPEAVLRHVREHCGGSGSSFPYHGPR